MDTNNSKTTDSHARPCRKALMSLIGSYVLVNAHSDTFEGGYQTYFAKVEDIQGHDLIVDSLDRPVGSDYVGFLNQISDGSYPQLTRKAENVFTSDGLNAEQMNLESTIITLDPKQRETQPQYPLAPTGTTGPSKL